MSIFKHTLKRIFRNKIQLIFIILFPLAYMSLGLIDDQQPLKAAIIDHDQTELTKRLIHGLETKADIKAVKEEDIEKELKALKVDYVLVIDQGFTERLIRGESGGLSEYTVKESNLSRPLSLYLKQWANHSGTIAAVAGHQSEAFYASYKQYEERAHLKLDSRPIENQQEEKSRKVLGFLVIPMLYTSLIAGLQIISNRNNHTLYRTLAAPVRIRSYMLQMIGSFLAAALIQLTFAMIVLKWGYRVPMNNSEWDIYALLILFSVAAVSFGVAVSSISKSILQACLIGICLIEPISMLGGAYGPLDWAPDVVKTISQFTPVYWVMDGIDQLLHGESLLGLGKEAVMIVLFAIIFFLLGTIRKTDAAK